jgi:hypothetical protein
MRGGSDRTRQREDLCGKGKERDRERVCECEELENGDRMREEEELRDQGRDAQLVAGRGRWRGLVN